MTSFQLDPSANAPCTSTIVGLGASSAGPAWEVLPVHATVRPPTASATVSVPAARWDAYLPDNDKYPTASAGLTMRTRTSPTSAGTVTHCT